MSFCTKCNSSYLVDCHFEYFLCPECGNTIDYKEYFQNDLNGLYEFDYDDNGKVYHKVFKKGSEILALIEKGCIILFPRSLSTESLSDTPPL